MRLSGHATRSRAARFWRLHALPDPAVVLILWIVLFAAACAAATLVAVERTAGRATASAHLAQRYDRLHADLVRLELLRHEVLLHETTAVSELSQARVSLDRDAEALVGAAALAAGTKDRDGDDGVFALRLRAYQQAEHDWERSRLAVDHGRLHVAVAALLTSLDVETAQHQRTADVAEARRKELLAALGWGSGPALVLLLTAAAAAARAAGRRRHELHLAAEIARWNSLHDALTGLPNRVALSEQMKELAPRSPVTLLCLDLDDFKAINDAGGHAHGDLVLTAFAERLRQAVRPGDFAARLGGDEFVVLCKAISDAPVAMVLAERLSSALSQPLVLASGRISVCASIGVAMAADGDGAGLLMAADAAMYQAKRLARGGVALFDEHLRAAGAERDQTALELKGAAARGELRLHYQPVVDLRTGTVRGVEALVRWQHPTRGLLAPDAFIEIAESTGAVIELGEWVLNEACSVLADWELDPPGGRRLGISVNVSAKQIADGRLVGCVKRALACGRFDAASLTVEVTESAVMVDVASAAQTLRQLRDLGVRLAIDDFGTGYSSLTYLRRFPIHELKLDKSFVDGVGDNAEDSAIVAAVVNLARAVSLEVVAEGVETHRQSGVLRTLGCDYGQGYLWQRPVPREVIDTWIAAHNAPRVTAVPTPRSA